MHTSLLVYASKIGIWHKLGHHCGTHNILLYPGGSRPKRVPEHLFLQLLLNGHLYPFFITCVIQLELLHLKEASLWQLHALLSFFLLLFAAII